MTKPKIQKQCIQCNNNFVVFDCHNYRKFCGQKCYGLSNLGKLRNKERIELKCVICEKSILVIKSQIWRKTCSKECSKINFKKKIPWNKGLKGYRAGENHQWFGRNMKGENSPVYIKDRTKLKKSDRKDKDSAYMDWRLQVYKRDNYKCKIADEGCKGRIEAHHILPWRDYKELRYNINNGITLCFAHHPRKRAEEIRLSPYFQELIIKN